MDKLIKYSVFSVALVLSYAIKAQEIETPRYIARIVEQLPCELPEKGTFVCSQLDSALPLYIERQEGAITQVGIRLFTSEMRQELDPFVCNAIERLFLELRLASDIQKQKRLLKEHQVTLVFNGFNLGTTQFPSLDHVIRLFRDDVQFMQKVENRKIILHVNSEADACVVTLPADRELLFAYDKKEHESILKKELEGWKGLYKRQSLPQKTDLEQVDNNLYVLSGAAYMIDSLRSDSYYTLKDGKVTPVFAEGECCKSLQNLLMGCVDMKDIHLRLRYHTYERIEKYCSMPLDLFLGYMQHQGLDFYSAAYMQNSSEMRGLLLMHHPVYDYVHMVIVNYDKSIFGPGQKRLTGDFYTFIPQHNIKSLFNF